MTFAKWAFIVCGFLFNFAVVIHAAWKHAEKHLILRSVSLLICYFAVVVFSYARGMVKGLKH